VSDADDMLAFAEERLAEDERELRNDPPVGMGYANLEARVACEIKGIRNVLERYRDCLIRMEDPAYPNAVARDQAREYEDFVLPNLLLRWAGDAAYRKEWAP
jgi:hypothetical protein